MASDLEKKIIKQIEYYFGDINLPRDKFLQEKIKEDEGWVPLSVLLTFKRLASISDSAEVIAEAMEKADPQLVDVSEDKTKLRRKPDLPLPEFNDERKLELSKRTAYARGFPLDEELGPIIDFLEPWGPVESCTRRSNKDHKFKGSCFIIFKDVDTAKKFIEEKEIKYKETDLLRKWQLDYFAEKRKQFEELKKAKAEKKLAKQQEQKNKEKPVDLPKGAHLHFTLTEGSSVTREDIKEKGKEATTFEIAYIDYDKGDAQGYARLAVENKAVEFHKALTDGELEIGETKLKFRVLEGEEEEEYLKKSSDAIIQLRQKQRNNKGGSRKRKGYFGGNKNGSKKGRAGD